MSSYSTRNERIHLISNARREIERACRLIVRDETADVREQDASQRTFSAVRDWSRKLDRDLDKGELETEPKAPDSPSAEHALTRIVARLDTIESWRRHVENRVLSKLVPLQEAVRFLLAKQGSEYADGLLHAILVGDAPKETTEGES